ncbi:transglycosylase domain-containing protein [Myceligenerans crystallogenes]|uniref:transglycosylase domain-containing protein n=1 Tax=Myceligenerans crystallogenes TaxID=316335 RepID=UPI0031DCACC1
MATWSAPQIPPFRPRARKQFWNYPRPYRTGWKAWLPSWRFVVGTMLAGFALIGGVAVAAWTGTTIEGEVATATLETSVVKFAGDGGTLGEFKAEEDRKIVTVDELPIWVANAPVASEERDFYAPNNLGISIPGIARSIINGSGGGSTLTQQYVEQYHMGWKASPTYTDKIREMIMAMKVRQDPEGYPVEKILDGYLNVINLGRGSFGIQSAANAYYGKQAKDLTPSESAFLAGIIPSPNTYDASEAGQEWAQGRWKRTLRLMHEDEWIDDAQYDEAVKAGFPTPKEQKPRSSMGGPKGYVLAEIERELADQGFDVSTLNRDGLVVHTTIDKKLQARAEKEAELPDDAKQKTRSSLVSIDPKTGAIRAMYGGPDYTEEKFGQNAATDNWQQGGSTYKPFTLIAALEKKISLYETYNGDEPQEFDFYTQRNEATGLEEPKPVTNFGNQDFGEINLLDATAHSVNTVYVQLNNDVTSAASADVAKRLGLGVEGSNAYRKWEDGGKKEGGPGEAEDDISNVLGTSYVYTVDLARAYATIANKGVRTTPHLVDKVVNPDTGEVLYQANYTPESDLFDQQVIADATYAMQQVVDNPEGSGHFARSMIPEERPLAGKTGSSNDNYSAWFAGFTPQLATVVGVYQFDTEKPGFEPITPFGGFEAVTGGTWPVQTWTKFMAPALEGMPIEEFPEPSLQPVPSPTPSPTISEPALIMVPTDLVGRPWADVQAALIALGLNPQPRTVQGHGNEAPETVVNVVQAGQEVPAGTQIDVEITGGEEETSTVPYVIDMNVAEAETTLRQAGYNVSQQWVENDAPNGTVIDQSPGAETELPPNQTVTIVVSNGPTEDPDDEPTCGGIFNDPCDDGGGEPSPDPTMSEPGTEPGPGGGNGNGNDSATE